LPPNLRVLSNLPAGYAAFSIADERAVRLLSDAEERHFWFSTRNHFLSERLQALGCVPPAHFLELGCGGGAVAAHLSRLGFEVTGVDGHLARVREAARRTPRGLFLVHDLEKGTQPLTTGAYEGVGLFDVLEHLDQPREALIAALRCARPGGLLVGTVPALMSLWSQIDTEAGHRLRYDEKSLTHLLESIPDASILEICPFNRTLVPILWFQRRLLRGKSSDIPVGTHLKVPPAAVNLALIVLVTIERRLAPALDKTRLPGASLWFALRKNAAPNL